MISEVIAVGLCINVLIVLTIWMTNKGTAEIFRRLKEKITSEDNKKRVYLTSGTIEHYELKITALEAQPTVSVFCPFPVKVRSEGRSVPVKTGSGLFKRIISRLAKNLTGKKVDIKNLDDFKGCQYLPSSRGVPKSLERKHKACNCSESILPSRLSKEAPEVPFSYKPSNKVALDYIKISKEITPYQVLSRSSELPKAKSIQRSKLAIRLEKKLPNLLESIEFAGAIDKTFLILSKVEKLDRFLLRRSPQKSCYNLGVILEDDDHNN